MRIIFCKTSYMKYYRGANENDVPYNGGSYVSEYGYGHEQYNFDPVELDDGKKYCLGFVETKSNSGNRNTLHIERIAGCEGMKNESSVDGVLVVWCATMDTNEMRVVGWYKNATVFTEYQDAEFDDGYIQSYNVIAEAKDCTLIPPGSRNPIKWQIPSARKRSYGFGQSLVWYANEPQAQQYIADLVRHIDGYDDENAMYIGREPTFKP